MWRKATVGPARGDYESAKRFNTPAAPIGFVL